MKKLIMSLFIAVAAITSCSKDEAATEVVKTNSNLLTRIESTVTTQGSTNVITSLNTLTYNGTKLVDIKSGTDISTYTYTGDLITKDTSTDTAEFSRTSVYTYDNNKLKSELETRNNTNSQGQVTVTKQKTTFAVQLDGTILRKSFTVDISTDVETEEPVQTVYTFLNNNLIKSVSIITGTITVDVNGTNTTVPTKNVRTETYEYDNKKNPFNNVAGFKNFKPETRSSANNLVKQTLKSERFVNDILDSNSGSTSTREYFFKYNTNDYPIERTYVYTTSVNDVISVKTSVSKYIYE